MKKFILLLLSLQCFLPINSSAQQPGSLDIQVRTDLSPGNDTVNSIQVQADGKIIAAGNSYNGMFSAIAVGRYNVNGSLDTTFGTNGIVTTFMDSAHTVANAVEIQQDGKIVVAGNFQRGNVKDFIIVRYKSDGSLDSSFGTNGVVTTDLNSVSDDFGNALAIQPDGKIIVAGGSGPYFGLCRYNSDGSLDTTFDSDGKAIISIIGPVICMKLQPDGKIVVASLVKVARLLANGSLDNSFGTNGEIGSAITAYAIAIQKDGKIVLAGGVFDFQLTRIDTSGGLDNSFGNGGIVTTYGFNSGCSTQGNIATTIALQPDGRILAGGWRRCGTLGLSRELVLARFNADGTLDNSFGVIGKVISYFFSGGISIPYSSVITQDGKIILAGSCGDYTGDVDHKWGWNRFHLGPMLDVNMIHGYEKNVFISPNPTADLLTIEATEIENGIWHLEINDLVGRWVYREEMVVTNGAIRKEVSVNNLPNGTYLLKLDNGKGKMMARVMKNK